MSTFDAEVSVYSATVGTPNEEALEAGAAPNVELGITAGLTLPIPNPQTGQALVIPIGRMRFVFTRDQAIEIFEGALEAAKALPEFFAPSGNVLVANNMSEVASAAEQMKRVTGQ